ncbi:hypothetical protein SHK09_15320 [Polaribacter sp. PL03]|uniref:hypothetical protein n=1 Tax=Polaribacter sp. PL03 TaxID=3088353 RepID=UPI0029D24445|nr:hypothetical protein [Polaribacter sp. PL03]MDX6748167.1 hypothetical protein [Polaribacter sp. PL03]
MKKELTEKESISIDLALKKFLDIHQKENVYKGALPFLLKETGINKERIEFIIIELSTLNILSYKNERGDKTLGHKFKREEIIELLKNGGMTNKWLEKENKRVNIKLINKTLSEFLWTKWIARISFLITIILLILKLIELSNQS